MDSYTEQDVDQLLIAAQAAADELSDIVDHDTSVGHYDPDTRYRDFICQRLEQALDKFPPPPPLNYEDESIQIDSDGQFLCLCGNSASRYGFYPCDPDGTPSDAALAHDSNRPPLWRCDECQRVFHGHTGTVLAEPPGQKKAGPIPDPAHPR